VRVSVGRIKGGANFLSWIEAKTRKLGGCCAGTTSSNLEGKIVGWSTYN
jgi:hypothetical protein